MKFSHKILNPPDKCLIMNGLVLKKKLQARGLNISEIARKLETSNQNVFAALAKDDLKTGFVERISDVTGISLAELYGIEAQPASSAVNTGTNNGNIAGRDITTNAQIADLQKIIAQQQKTITELSATIAKLIK